MIILPILATSLTDLPFEMLGECTFWAQDVIPILHLGPVFQSPIKLILD